MTGDPHVAAAMDGYAPDAAAAAATVVESSVTAAVPTVLRLEGTPFGARTSQMLPNIKNEVLIGARRGLNRWFLSLCSGSDGAKAGCAALCRCSSSVAFGPGRLGLVGKTRAMRGARKTRIICCPARVREEKWHGPRGRGTIRSKTVRRPPS